MKLFVFFVFVAVVKLCACSNASVIENEAYRPTESEIAKALSFQKVREDWGYQARQERSLRVFAIGGSNTRLFRYAKAIITDFANETSHPLWNCSFDKIGVTGVDAKRFIGARFGFESWEHSLWPNVIMLDFSANVQTWKSSTAGLCIDIITRYVRSKYSALNLTEPAIMFLEFFHGGALFDDLKANPNASWQHKQEILRHEICNEVSDNRCSNYLQIRKVAAFYQYPIVSWRELALDALVRFYLKNNTKHSSNTDHEWLYCPDGAHFSYPGGVYFYDTLLGPFFRHIMTPRLEPKWDGRSPFMSSQTKRLYPPTNISLDMVTFVGSMLNSVVHSPVLWYSWEFHAENYLCSSDKKSGISLSIQVPTECNRAYSCSLSVGFVHSWNASHYGHLSCKVYDQEHTMVKQMLVNSTHDDTGKLIRHTLSLRTSVSVNRAGNFSLYCDKLDDRLTCLTSVAVRNIVEV